MLLHDKTFFFKKILLVHRAVALWVAATRRFMIITNLRQPYRWNALYQTLILNGKRVVKVIEREGYPIAYIIKANVIVIYDKADIYKEITRESLHFDLDSNKIWRTNK